jgi:hypothetical protein
MSFELSVFVPTPAEDILPAWRRELARHGLECEFFPGFSLRSWAGGHLPVRLTVSDPASFPQARRYGSEPLLAGFEIDITQAEASDLPDAVRSELGMLHVAFRTAMGRSVADLRLQCIAAASLAGILGGLYFDPQQGVVLEPEQALKAALSEAAGFEEAPVNPADWQLTPFPGWPAVS